MINMFIDQRDCAPNTPETLATLKLYVPVEFEVTDVIEHFLSNPGRSNQK
jgi:hypothetical protein